MSPNEPSERESRDSLAPRLASQQAIGTTCRPRLWPGVVIVVAGLLVIVIPRWVAPDRLTSVMLATLWGPIVSSALVVLWWLAASGVRWTDRLLGISTFTSGAVGSIFVCHPTMKLCLVAYALPTVMTAWVVWLVATHSLAWEVRRRGLPIVLLLTWGLFALLRLDGIDATLSPALCWRWSETPEERFLAEHSAETALTPACPTAPLTLSPGDWPSFRGPHRDARLGGVSLLATDWGKRPPRQLWRHRVGPGWSSFAVVGKHLFTQEQRGEDEVVVCYNANTGEELWVHADQGRFTEATSGPGPRATPTFHEGRLFALGATGRLNCLDASTGEVLWSRDVRADADAPESPRWGYASSPMVARGFVLICAGGGSGTTLRSYRADTGEFAWSAGHLGEGYCSPQLARIAGVEQVLLATSCGLAGFDPDRGALLWEHRWRAGSPRVTQPAPVSDTDVLIGTGFRTGTRRVRIGRDGDSWSQDVVWTTEALRPYFNDFVVHKGHLYGFCQAGITCVRLADGQRCWQGGHYPHGQLLLLADQDVLLVVTEQGEVALVEANPEKQVEWGRFKALEGKTWNHPVIAQGKLFVRNGQEAACFELELK